MTPCGALSAAAVCLGLRHRCPIKDKPKAKQARVLIRQYSSDLVQSFAKEFGAINCLDLIGIDFSTPDGYQKFLSSGIWEQKCNKHIEFVISKLYDFEEDNRILPLA